MRSLSKSRVFAGLPPVWQEELRSPILNVLGESDRTLVVLDDDPTGTQTVYDIPVLTTWEIDTLQSEFNNRLPCFYILTNSRSLGQEPARALNKEIAGNVIAAADRAGRDFIVVSRSDSTLRGHYPLETDVWRDALGMRGATILVPYFEAGGRYTIEDVHYVAEDDVLTPAAETPFARDPVFGYSSSDLREYIEEKTCGTVSAAEVVSVSLKDLRCGGPEAVEAKLAGLPNDSVCIVNAAAPRDLEVFSLAVLKSEKQGRRFMFRTAAEFVSARLGLELRPNWRPSDCRTSHGGLTIVGSHVPRSTSQLERLLADTDLVQLEVRVERLLQTDTRESEIQTARLAAEKAIASGRDVVVFTSRDVRVGEDAASSLTIGEQVSAALVTLLQRLESEPRYVVAKGGVTSSDLATKALGVKRAIVRGQILPGIPVWELGLETKHPGLSYIVFPGNVGDPSTLLEVVTILKPHPDKASTP
jgi:uncharacterized protein YgbK (DUF1537 family)